MELALVFMFMLLNNSILLMVGLVISLLSICVILSFILNSYFFSFMIFMLFMSGVVILFMYLCSVMEVEKVTMGFGKLSVALLFMSILGITGAYSSLFKSFGSGLVYSKYISMELYSEIYFSAKFMSLSYVIFSLFFVAYLLVCLVVVYEVIKISSGPLRIKT